MSIGNLFGLGSFLEALPVVGGIVKQADDTVNQAFGAGDKLFGTDRDETPKTFDEDSKPGESSVGTIGNLMSTTSPANKAPAEAETAARQANVAKTAAADSAEAEEIAAMLL
jgi:hypothetical protein